MLQVLFHIPMRMDGIPLWLVALVVGLTVSLALHLLSRRVKTADLTESLRVAAKGGAFLTVGAAAGAYFADSQGYFKESGIPIYGFGMMLFLAFILCTWLGGRRGEYEGISKETIQDLAIWIFAGGLLGARLTSLLTTGKYPTLASWGAFRLWLYELVAIWDGGIVLYGAVIGGVATYFLAYFVMYRKRGIQTGQPAVEGPLTPSRFLARMGAETRRLADVVAPAIALGIGLGRMGCFLNGCCYGGVTCAACQLVGVGFPIAAPPLQETDKGESLVERGYQTRAGFTLQRQRHEVFGGGWEVTPRVEQVDPASAAHRAGLRPNDRITKVNGHAITSASELDAYLGALKGWPRRGESELKLEVERKGEAEPKEITFYPRTLPLYPTQLFEVVSMGLLMLLLFAYERFRRNPGQVAAVLMLCYGVHRYLNEILRDDPRPMGMESYGSVILVGLGVALWVWLQWFKEPEGPATPVGDAAKRLGLAPTPVETPKSAAPAEAVTPATPGP
jgi:prolipoprotein diacylglyceryltransferase